jgi:hypothetical protein
MINTLLKKKKFDTGNNFTGVSRAMTHPPSLDLHVEEALPARPPAEYGHAHEGDLLPLHLHQGGGSVSLYGSNPTTSCSHDMYTNPKVPINFHIHILYSVQGRSSKWNTSL